MNPLDPTMDWHRTSQDALSVTSRAIRRSARGVVTQKHIFHRRPRNENEARIGVPRKQLDDYTVLALVAVFERVLRDHVVAVLDSRFAAGTPVEKNIAANARGDAEYWNFSARLIDLFETVHQDVRGRAKQFVSLRNWFAHGHHASVSAGPPPVSVRPREAHRVLTTFLQQAGLL